MASVQVETRKAALKILPDFSFPPKNTHSSPTISKVIPQEPVPHSRQNFSLPSYSTISASRNPSPGPTHLPEIMTPITPLTPSPKGPTILTIPLEIRLEIWNYVLLSHPIHHAHLSPILNSPENQEEFHTSMLRPQGLSYPTSTSAHLLTTSQPYPSSANDCSAGRVLSQTRHTKPTRIQGKMPTALLLTSRQIYTETRPLPFTTSHFAFVNWFWSGIYAGRQFTRALRPWQSASMRYVSIEVLGRDLWNGGTASLSESVGGGATSTAGVVGAKGDAGARGVREWRELCSLWEGVWGLRLVVKGSLVSCSNTAIGNQEGWNSEDGKWTGGEQANSRDRENEKQRVGGILDARMEWVVDGLLRMKSLRWIELEIEDEDVERGVKLEFCVELENVLSQLRNRDDGWMDDVKVRFVERAGEVEERVYYGEPGDDEVWRADA